MPGKFAYPVEARWDIDRPWLAQRYTRTPVQRSSFSNNVGYCPFSGFSRLEASFAARAWVI